MTLMSPVTVTKMSPIVAASAIGMTRKPSMAASRARSGSTSVTMTWRPALGPHGDARAAPAVAADDEVLARQQDVGGADDAVDRALAGAVAVVEEVLGVGVVDGDDRDT